MLDQYRESHLGVVGGREAREPAVRAIEIPGARRFFRAPLRLTTCAVPVLPATATPPSLRARYAVPDSS